MLVPLMLLQTLFFKTTAGDVYQAIDNVPAGQCVLTGSEELVFEATNFNTCNEIVLQPGCYRAELRGGVGTMNEYCLEAVEQNIINTMSALFSISEPTTIYALRGGDGNAGGVNLSTSGNYTGAFGGGASGVDSILVVDDKIWRANGGTGKTCAISAKKIVNTTVAGYALGNGQGGNAINITTDSKKRAFYYYVRDSSVIYSVGGGGGGAPNRIASKGWYRQSPLFNEEIVIDAGTDGTPEVGGNGGDIKTCTTLDCAEFAVANGGYGGATVEFNCGGQVAYSYGGGGGGGAALTNLNAINGGDGGSGSTGTSNISFLRIYKM